jgi:hypothetical protein
MNDRLRRIALALGGCSFLPGSAHKRFAREMAEAARSEQAVVTPRQAARLLRLAHRYRRQLSPSISQLRLDEAEALAEMHPGAFERKPAPAPKPPRRSCGRAADDPRQLALV